MKYYTKIKSEILPVKIISNTNGVYKVEAEDITGKIFAFRVVGEVFTNKAKAAKYFK